MNLGAFMNPEFPIFSTTLCYLERDDAYLMLHRIKKQDDYNHDKWIGVGGKFERGRLLVPPAAPVPPPRRLGLPEKGTRSG